MATQILVIFIIRTNGRPWKDFPQPALIVSSLVALSAAMLVPFTPAGRWFGFEAPPLALLAAMGLLIVLYLVCAELLKSVAVAPSAAAAASRGKRKAGAISA
jgi:Mg2+-importing ATPase